jgi:hypothetical protein
MLSMKGYKSHYLKTKRGAKTPDYLVEYEKERFVIEISGKGKGREQSKGIKIEKKLILSGDPKAGSGKKPISLMGFIK